jgi:hypothetical protein
MPKPIPIVKNKSVIGGCARIPWTRQLDLIEELISKHGGVLRDRRNIPEKAGKFGRIYVEFEVALTPGGQSVIVRPETRYSTADKTSADHAASALMILVKALFVGIQYHVGLQAISGAAVDPQTGYTYGDLAELGNFAGIPAIEDHSRH